MRALKTRRARNTCDCYRKPSEFHSKVTRERIRAGVIIDRFQKHFMGELRFDHTRADGDARQAFALLRIRGERPRCRPAEQRDELASPSVERYCCDCSRPLMADIVVKVRNCPGDNFPP